MEQETRDNNVAIMHIPMLDRNQIASIIINGVDYLADKSRRIKAISINFVAGKIPEIIVQEFPPTGDEGA